MPLSAEPMPASSAADRLPGAEEVNTATGQETAAAHRQLISVISGKVVEFARHARTRMAQPA
jgi:hypothetical protein